MSEIANRICTNDFQGLQLSAGEMDTLLTVFSGMLNHTLLNGE